MKLLLIHLSDIHLRGDSDPILQRGKCIADAVKNFDYEINLAVVVISGDIASTGYEGEYVLASEFIEELSKCLSEGLGSGDGSRSVPVYCVVVPGNHDCYFSGSDKARNMVIDGVRKEKDQARDSSVVEICTGIQSSFFQFSSAVASQGKSSGMSVFDERLYYEYYFSVEGETVRFVCCNTAWLSRKNEQQGDLFFPPSAVCEDEGPYVLSVATLHHPYNWLEADTARKFRNKIERVADIILTGHEHDPSRRKQESGSGEFNTYIEGGVLQATDSEESDFNALVVDTTTKKQKFAHLAWDGKRYELSEGTFRGSNGAGLAWEDYQVSRLRQREEFELKKNMSEYLEDPGLTLTQRDRGKLKLSDVFVFPDLHEVAYVTEEATNIVKGDRVLDFIIGTPHLLIVGDSQSGKTSLAKTLFINFHSEGKVPVLADGRKNPPGGARLYEYPEKLFVEQYGNASLAAYRQLDRKERVIIVDDYHKLVLKEKAKRKFVEALAKFAGHVILIAHDLELAMIDLAHPDSLTGGFVPFGYYRIQPFGHVRRNALVEKWLLLGADNEINSGEFAHHMTMITRTLDTLIGENYVPAYPVYVLSVLQASEAATPIDTRASTHGYFYELFIRINLSRGRTTNHYDVTSAYLAFLAYQLFSRKMREIDHEQFAEIHTEYEKRYQIKREFGRMRSELIQQDMLVTHNDKYRFKYPFIYYYFVASYMRDHIHEDTVRDEVSELSKMLYVEQYANILLFLAHLCKDPVIIGQMLRASEDVYCEIKPALLYGDIEFLENLGDVAETIILEERDTRQTRQDRLESLDHEHEVEGSEEYIEESLDWEDAPSTTINPIMKLNAALKTLQILGQILKNFPGSMEGQKKYKIADSCYRLGLRTLSIGLNLIRDKEKELLQEFIDVLFERHPNFDANEVKSRAQKTLFGLAQIISFTLVKRISNAVGSPELFVTYEQIVKEKDSPASPAVRLVDASLAIDHARHFPDCKIIELSKQLRKKWFAHCILQYLVVEHLYLFDVDFRIKQRLCQALGIAYKRMQSTDPSRKMLTGPS